MNILPYELVDFGMGRKLESLGGYRVDRPSPAADHAVRQTPIEWAKVDAKYDVDGRRWKFYAPWPDDLAVDCGGFVMPVRATPYGHVGLFPEQHENWQWLMEGGPGSKAVETQDGEPALGLNLFGYTGASTMAMVAAGLAVAHVDAAKPNVEAARLAAARNDWQDKPIRYLIEDAAKFAAREVRRKRHYHTIVLDPPAYGHTPAGKAWRLERDLWPLLEDCFALLRPDPAKRGRASTSTRLLVTGHSPDVAAQDIVSYVRSARAFKSASLRIDTERSELETSEGRKLNAGFSVRIVIKWPRRN